MMFHAGTVRDIPVLGGLHLCGLTWTGECLWYSEAVGNSIAALDPLSGQILRRIACPGLRTDLTTIGGNLVQVAGEDRSLRFIAPDSGEIVGELPNPRPGNTLCGLEATRNGLWLGYEDLKVIELRSTDNMELIDSVRVIGPVAGVTASDDYLAYSDFRGSTISLVSLADHRESTRVSVNGSPTGIAWDGNLLWYCDYATFQVRAIEIPGIAGGRD